MEKTLEEKNHVKFNLVNNKFKINDRFILIMFVGTLSAFIAVIFGYLFKLLYPTTIIMPEIALLTWVNPSQMHTILGYIFGNLCSYIAGVIHALAFIVCLDLTGWKFFWLKSFGISTIGWLISSIIFFRILNLMPHELNDILSNVIFYGDHVIYLSISALLVNKFGVPNVHK